MCRTKMVVGILDSAFQCGENRLLKASDMCSGCLTGSTSVFKAGGEEIAGLMHFGGILIKRGKIPYNVLKYYIQIIKYTFMNCPGENRARVL